MITFAFLVRQYSLITLDNEKKIKLRKFSKGWQFPKYQRKTKFTFKSKNQYGEFTTNKKIGTPTENETISPSEVLKIKKILKTFLD